MKRFFFHFILILTFNSISAAIFSQNFTPGISSYDTTGYVEYIAGNLPVIISVPHGGSLEPNEIPDRDCGSFVCSRDLFTQELGRKSYALKNSVLTRKLLLKNIYNIRNIEMNLKEKVADIKEYFSPKIIGEVNDVYVKVAKIKGDKVPWHNHKNEDELFYVIEGQLLFEIEGKDSFLMNQGDMFIVKRGINHRVSSKEECKIMLIENKSTAHTGTVKSEITKSIDDQY